MGIINRFLLFVYAGIALLFSLLVVAIVNEAFPADVLLNEILFLLNQSATVTAAAVIAALSAYFMLYCFFIGENKKAAPKENGVVIKTETGDVRVAKEAIEALADKEATSVKGVRESVTKVISSVTEGQPRLSIKQELILLSGSNVPTISAEVVNAVKSRVFESLGEKDVPVEISVRDLNSMPAESQKRVH